MFNHLEIHSELSRNSSFTNANNDSNVSEDNTNVSNINNTQYLQPQYPPAQMYLPSVPITDQHFLQQQEFPTINMNMNTNLSQEQPRTMEINRPTPTFVCRYCQKISDSCYFCYGQPCNFDKKLKQFHLYNEPNNFTMQDVVNHCDPKYIYEENVDNVDRIYDPYITRCKTDDDIISDGNNKKIKKDHPGFCKYCTLSTTDHNWDTNFYERNNSRYRGHMINTHGIHPNGKVALMPQHGMFCYKWIRNHWFETSGFLCPYGCGESYTIGEKGHGFHEYLRHWSKCHANGD